MAGEILAHIGGGIAVDGGHLGESGDPAGEAVAVFVAGEQDDGGEGTEAAGGFEQEGFGFGVAGGPGDDDLGAGGEVAKPGGEQERGGGPLLHQSFGEGAEGIEGGVAEVRHAGVAGEAEEVQDRDGIAGGFGAVVVLFEAEDEVGGVVGREKSAVFAVFEEFEEAGGEVEGGLEVGGIEGGFVEIEEGLDEEGVIIEEAGDGAFAFAPAAIERAGFGIVEVFEDKRGCAKGGIAAFLGEIRVVGSENAGAAGEGGDHQGVPGGDDFVVKVGAGAFGALGEEFGAHGGEGGFEVGGSEGVAPGGGVQSIDFTEDIAAGELAVGVLGDVAVFLAAVVVGEPLGALFSKDFNEFRVGPDVESAFGLVVGMGGVGGGIGVFGGVESAFGVG